MIPWIFSHLDRLSFTSALDLFGGTGIISHGFQLRDKKVFYNDFLKSNQISVSGLLNSTRNDIITNDILDEVLTIDNLHVDDQFLTKYLADSYFFPNESEWIAKISSKIGYVDLPKSQKCILFFALSQSCLKKRPFHTFHGSFLNLRLKKRNEKQTWDIDMSETFQKIIKEVNTYLTNLPAKLPDVNISGFNASEVTPEMISSTRLDLVYIDPPFISNKKKRTLRFANYIKNYHVLELLANYENISTLIDPSSGMLNPEKYLPVKEMDLWIDQNQKKWFRAFDQIIKNFQDSIIVVSYRSDSLISQEDLLNIIGSYKNVELFTTPHIYEVAEKESKFDDFLIIGK